MKSGLLILLSALTLVSAPSFAQQADDAGNLFPPAYGTTSSGGAINGVGCGSGTTTTFYTANNGQSGNMFDIAVHGADITLECIDIHTSALTTVNVEVWAVPGTCVGKDTGDMCAHGWYLVGTGSATGMGTGVPTNVILTPGNNLFTGGATYGLYVTLIGSTAIRYTNGAGVPGGPYPGTHCDISTYYGKSAYTPPCTLGSTFQPREWNGTLYTELAGPPTPTLTASGTCPGVVQLEATHVTPNQNVLWLYGHAGTFTQNNPNVNCFGTVIAIGNPRGGVLRADSSGVATLQISAHTNHCGTRVIQVVDLTSCVPTNPIAL